MRCTGWLLRPDGAIGAVKLLPLFDLVGTMFINLLKMLIVPLILASVITGVAALGYRPGSRPPGRQDARASTS